MLNLARGIRVFLATTPLDMRGSYDAMAGRARRLGLEPVDDLTPQAYKLAMLAALQPP